MVPITIVTAASGNHACALEAFLYHLNATLSHLATSHKEDEWTREERIRRGQEYIATSRDFEDIRPKAKRPKGTSKSRQEGQASNHHGREDTNKRGGDGTNGLQFGIDSNGKMDDTVYEIRPKVIVYNMGMGPTKRKKRQFKALIEAGYIDEPIDFDFEKYPAFWRLGTETRGEYGWKAGLINEVTQRTAVTLASPNARTQSLVNGTLTQRQLYQPEIVLWLDSGDRVNVGFLRWLPSFMRQHGLWTPQSQGDMRTWTHPGLLSYYHDSLVNFENETNCNGAAIAFDIRNTTVREGILKEWVQCSMNKECIAPEGSSRENHRQDQAALTYLVKAMGYGDDLCHGFPAVFGVQVNQDRYCKEDVAAYPNRVVYSS